MSGFSGAGKWRNTLTAAACGAPLVASGGGKGCWIVASSCCLATVGVAVGGAGGVPRFCVTAGFVCTTGEVAQGTGKPNRILAATMSSSSLGVAAAQVSVRARW